MIRLGAASAAPDERDIYPYRTYLCRRGFEQLDDVVAVGPSIPNVGVAPVGAVDLLDSADPCHWLAAEELCSDA